MNKQQTVSIQQLHDSISEKIFQIDPLIRFVGVFSNNDFQYSYRKCITPYIDQEKTKKSLEQAVKRWEEREELFSSEIGNPMYSLTMYETVKRIVMKLKDGSILLISTELEIDHERLLIKLMDYSDSLTNKLPS